MLLVADAYAATGQHNNAMHLFEKLLENAEVCVCVWRAATNRLLCINQTQCL